MLMLAVIQKLNLKEVRHPSMFHLAHQILLQSPALGAILFQMRKGLAMGRFPTMQAGRQTAEQQMILWQQ